MKHETSENDQMKISKCSGKPLIIAHQPPKAHRLGEGAFHHEASGQQNKAALGLRKFDDFQLNAVLPGDFRRNVAAITLINEGKFDRLARHLLHYLSKLAHLCTVLLIGRGH
jgi:hypothetical protein